MEFIFASKCRLINFYSACIVPVRFVKQRKTIRYMKGLPPYKAKTLQDKLQDAAFKNPLIHYRVDIGLPQNFSNQTVPLKEQKLCLKKSKEDPFLEEKSRKSQICFDEISKDWTEESAPKHIRQSAEHYGIFQDLFGDAFFEPQVNLDVTFEQSKSFIPVFRGNSVKPSQAVSPPIISYKASKDSFWTLVTTNPDGHLQEENAELLHWFVGNIPGHEVSQGEIVAKYVQPFPARGTGHQRFIFILYKQTEKLDYSSLKRDNKQITMKDLTFKTFDFYSKYQDKLTPAGLAFCQVDWDLSVSNFFHTVLDIEEPVFEYDFDPHYYKKQKKYPIRQPFNLYLDRYRDPKSIGKEYLLKKLNYNHPFNGSKPGFAFPNALPIYHDLDEKLHGKIPSWLRREKLKQRLGHGRINDY